MSIEVIKADRRAHSPEHAGDAAPHKRVGRRPFSLLLCALTVVVLAYVFAPRAYSQSQQPTQIDVLNSPSSIDETVNFTKGKYKKTYSFVVPDSSNEIWYYLKVEGQLSGFTLYVGESQTPSPPDAWHWFRKTYQFTIELNEANAKLPLNLSFIIVRDKDKRVVDNRSESWLEAKKRIEEGQFAPEQDQLIRKIPVTFTLGGAQITNESEGMRPATFIFLPNSQSIQLAPVLQLPLTWWWLPLFFAFGMLGTVWVIRRVNRRLVTLPAGDSVPPVGEELDWKENEVDKNLNELFHTSAAAQSVKKPRPQPRSGSKKARQGGFLASVFFKLLGFPNPAKGRPVADEKPSPILLGDGVSTNDAPQGGHPGGTPKTVKSDVSDEVLRNLENLKITLPGLIRNELMEKGQLEVLYNLNPTQIDDLAIAIAQRVSVLQSDDNDRPDANSLVNIRENLRRVVDELKNINPIWANSETRYELLQESLTQVENTVKRIEDQEREISARLNKLDSIDTHITMLSDSIGTDVFEKLEQVLRVVKQLEQWSRDPQTAPLTLLTDMQDAALNKLDMLRALIEQRMQSRNAKEYVAELDQWLQAQMPSLIEHLSRIQQELKMDGKEQVAAYRDEMKVFGERLNEYRRVLEAAVGVRQEESEEALRTLQASIERQERQQSAMQAGLLGEIVEHSLRVPGGNGLATLLGGIGSAYQRYFKDGAFNPGGLDELRQRISSINHALQTAVETMCQGDANLEEKLNPYVRRISALSSTFNEFYEQLRSKQLHFTPRLEIPLPPPGVNDAEDDEKMLKSVGEWWGLSIKREFDKLQDPEAYWEREIEQTALATILPVVDKCDSDIVTPPGTNQSVEEALQVLFRHVGLTDILPQEGDEFLTAHQQLIRIVPGEPGKSMKVACVVKRGFYHSTQGKEKLIRKAGVNVYA